MLGFFSEFIAQRQQIGAVAPSSRRLAAAMTAHIGASDDERVLEVGAGTGVLTRAILDRLGPGSSFDIVEINPRFCAILRERVVGPSGTGAGHVRVIEAPLEQASLAESYTAIVCGLPFNVFEPSVARGLFRLMLDRLEPGGVLSYFEYAGIRPIKRLLPGARAAVHHGRYVRRLETRLGWRRQLVLGNIPPAWAVHLRRRERS